MSESGMAARRFLLSMSSWVTGLRKISSSVTLISFPGRDDADDFFAIARTPIHVHDQQRHFRAVPDGMPSLLAVVADSIGIQHNQRIGENQRGILKRHAVLRQ